jgi:hypothetical protein
MGDNNEVIFADKENDVDWDVVLEVKEADYAPALCCKQ